MAHCPDCGAENGTPAATDVHVDEIFDGNIDVDTSAEVHTQLECQDCGAILGYLASGTAVGSSNVRGFY